MLVSSYHMMGGSIWPREIKWLAEDHAHQGYDGFYVKSEANVHSAFHKTHLILAKASIFLPVYSIQFCLIQGPVPPVSTFPNYILKPLSQLTILKVNLFLPCRVENTTNKNYNLLYTFSAIQSLSSFTA